MTRLKNPKTYVDQLLALHSKYYQINQQVFSSDPLFTAAVDKAFRTVINGAIANSSTDGPETLARYCDMMMKKNAGKKEVVSTTAADGKRKGAMRKVDLDEGDAEERLMRMVRL